MKRHLFVFNELPRPVYLEEHLPCPELEDDIEPFVDFDVWSGASNDFASVKLDGVAALREVEHVDVMTNIKLGTNWGEVGSLVIEAEVENEFFGKLIEANDRREPEVMVSLESLHRLFLSLVVRFPH